MRSFSTRLAGIFAFALLSAATTTSAQVAPPAETRDLTALPEPLPPITAGSAVLIVESPAGAADESDAAFQRRINTHIASLRSEQTIRRMLSSAQSATRKTSWFTAANGPAERAAWLRDHLRATQVPGTPLIEVSLNDVADPLDRRTILQDVCNTYLDSAHVARRDVLSDRTQVLNNVKVKLEMRLKDLSSEMRDKQIKLNDIGGGIGRIGIKEIELQKLVSAQVDAQLEAGRLRAAYDTLAAAVSRGQAVDAMTPRPDARQAALQNRLDDAEIRLEVAQARLGDKDPAVADLRVETAYLRRKLDAMTVEAAAKAKVAVLEEAQHVAEQASIRYEGLVKRVDYMKSDLGELSNALIVYLNLQDEQKGLREQLQSVKQQVEQVMSTQAGPGLAGIRWHLLPEAGADKQQ